MTAAMCLCAWASSQVASRIGVGMYLVLGVGGPSISEVALPLCLSLPLPPPLLSLYTYSA
jgi:hypothetical protein